MYGAAKNYYGHLCDQIKAVMNIRNRKRSPVLHIIEKTWANESAMMITLFVCSHVWMTQITAWLHSWTIELWMHYPLTQCTSYSKSCSQSFEDCIYIEDCNIHIYRLNGPSNIKITIKTKLIDSKIPNTWLMAMFANRLSRLVSRVALPRSSSSFHETTPF